MNFNTKKGDRYTFNLSLAPGMDLRDWFAGMALQGMLAYSHVGPNGNYHENCSTEACVDCAYQYADAMMEQRQRPATSGKE